MRLYIIIFTLLSGYNAFSQYGVFPFSENGKWGIIDSDKKVLMKPSYGFEIPFFKNHDGKYPLAIYKKDSLFGVLNKNGEVLAKPIYENINATHAPVIILQTTQNTNVYNLDLRKIVLTISNTSKLVLSINMPQNEITISNSKEAKVFGFNGKYKRSWNIPKKVASKSESPKTNSVANNWHPKISILGSKASTCDKALKRFKKKLNRIDSEIELIQDVERTDKCYPTLSIVSKNGKQGLLNSNFKMILDFLYDEIIYLYNHNAALIKVNNKYGYFDINRNKIIIPIEYDKIETTGFYIGSYNPYYYTLMNYLLIEKGNFSGYVDKTTGEVFLPK
ncbi:hypothetical protein GCM10023314_11300 [Algibacter agarivorans]|uniref:WG containing repeat-containing protein n=1 Tax=Algibacter agarivorans TaxID=1109741 RepID=A0ABP9GG96_9FLAO